MKVQKRDSKSQDNDAGQEIEMATIYRFNNNIDVLI